ncbi:MAG TPA: type VI secretion system contractile sheath large subunit [Phycisphaerae bacterium]|nr:type VI secretion system contractile sheath large subunit [Phycisphaerae bacterium]HPM22292.1 type VI secretion system contractile sheath large subunit [Phycisphaerae bacterium]HQL53204.1 type VI secretion system contractile sheath large subunit [Phycisphaerae bacterium]
MAEQPQAAGAAGAAPADTSTVDALIDQLDLDHAYIDLYRKGIAGLVQKAAGLDLNKVTLNKQVVDDFISEIDQQISAQVNEVLHNDQFQKLESAWRSLWYLISNTEFRQNIRIEVLNAKKEDLLEDFQDCKDWQKSGLFKTVYRDQYNTFGGNPYGLMVANYELDYRNPDVELMSEIARVSAVAKCPFIAGASPKMFDKKMDDFGHLPKLAEMYEIFEQPMYTKWNSFRDSDDARYVGLAMPRFLLRAPYTVANQDVKDFVFEEDVRTENHDRYLWGNAAFALAGRMTESFAKFGWYNAIVGPTSGGTVPNLPLHQYEATGQYHTKIPTETLISEDMDVDLCNFGFIPLVMRKGSDNAAFFDAPSAKRVGKFPDTAEGKEDETRARLGMSLPYLMIQCRIAHYMKVIWRENMGRVMDAEKMVNEINNWLKQYCRQGTLDEELASKYPLKEIQVSATPVPGKPGMFKSEIQMIPHFRLKGVEVQLSMVGQFDPPPQ